jgi:hypothetical protein
MQGRLGGANEEKNRERMEELVGMTKENMMGRWRWIRNRRMPM